MQVIYHGVAHIRSYIEDPSNPLAGGYLSDAEYQIMVDHGIIPCTDIVIVDREREAIWLAHRNVKPMPYWWVLGGRAWRGELWETSALRNFQREALLEIDPNRFGLLAQHRYIWKEREQEPQDRGSDNSALTYGIELTEAERSSIRLEKKEYKAGMGLQPFDRERMRSTPNLHPMLTDLYNQIFP